MHDKYLYEKYTHVRVQIFSKSYLSVVLYLQLTKYRAHSDCLNSRKDERNSMCRI